MDVQTQEYKGKDRRNGSKLRLHFADYFKIMTFIGGAIIVGVTGWVTLKMNVQAIADDVKENKECIEKTNEKDDKQEKILSKVTNDIENIKGDVQDIKVEQKETKALLIEVLREVKK